MNILFLHNRYLIAGGEDVSTESEIELLRSKGHNVDTFFADNASVESTSKLRLAIDTVWSQSKYKMLTKMIAEKKYDIIHVQNFFPLISPSVFYAAKAAGVKVVMSVRNYRLICPNALLFVNDAVCTSCVGKTIPYPGVIKKCYKSSMGASLVTAAMLSVHNVMNTWNRKIDGFICISEFVKEQLLNGGIRNDKIYVKHNFLKKDYGFSPDKEDFYLYVGRLSVEKGIDVMLDAFDSPELREANAKLIIIGDGPLSDVVKEATVRNSNIVYLGRKSQEESYSYMSKAKFLIFPSKWHEPFGRTIVEAFAVGTPVIGARGGGVTELISDGQNGFLFTPSEADSLKAAILKTGTADFNNMSAKARESYEANYTSEVNYRHVMDIYSEIMTKT